MHLPDIYSGYLLVWPDNVVSCWEAALDVDESCDGRSNLNCGALKRSYLDMTQTFSLSSGRTLELFPEAAVVNFTFPLRVMKEVMTSPHKDSHITPLIALPDWLTWTLRINVHEDALCCVPASRALSLKGLFLFSSNWIYKCSPPVFIELSVWDGAQVVDVTEDGVCDVVMSRDSLTSACLSLWTAGEASSLSQSWHRTASRSGSDLQLMNPRRRGVAPGRPAEAKHEQQKRGRKWWRRGEGWRREEKGGGEIKSEIMF